MHMTVKERQRLLAERGFYHGQIDGIDGRETSAATIAFKKSVGLRARDFVGPVTMMALRKGITPASANIASDGHVYLMPTWLRLAYSHLGLREIKGRTHNMTIVGFWERLGLHFRDDETPWCAGFVNAMIRDAGLPIVAKNRAAALEWCWNGYGQRLKGPALGAVMSITRPGRTGSGHMAFVVGRAAHDNIMGLGGNQGDAVSINPYHPTRRDAQYHWPMGVSVPSGNGMPTLPIITSAGGHLINEA